MSERCDNCRYSRRHGEAYVSLHCHRQPPIWEKQTCIPSIPSFGMSTETETVSYFPQVDADCWCGEWVAKGEGE